MILLRAQLSHYFVSLIEPLNNHLEKNHVEYLQFAFRWMNNLLMREMPLRSTIRLWDTYLVSAGNYDPLDQNFQKFWYRTELDGNLYKVHFKNFGQQKN